MTLSSSAARCRVPRRFYSLPTEVASAATDLRNQLSHLCVARSRRGRQVAHRPRSMQVNATRPDAQRLQSATCRKQPGARRCRRAAGGRCVTMCSFFPSYFRPSFSSPSLSRDHRLRTYVHTSLEMSRARASFATDTYAQFSDVSRTDAAPESTSSASR